MSTSYGSSRRYISPQRSRPDTSHRHDHYDATSRDDRYDSRYRQQHPNNSHHHHHISSSNAYESEAASRREPRRRRSWPPQPYVEDEEDVVHRETGWSKRRVRQHLRTPVPFRGSIDQESVLEYALPPPQASSKASTDSRASRSDTNKTSSTSHSEDERTRRRQQEQQQQPSQKPPINLSDVVPEMRDRRSSPYTFSKKAQPDTNILDLERTRSPEAIVYASDASKRPVIRSGLGTESRPIPPEPLQRAHSTKDERYRGNHPQPSDPAYGSSAQYQQQRTSDKSSGDYHKPRDSVFDSSDARQLPIRVDRDKHDANENLQRQHAPSQPVRSNTSDQDAERNRNNEFLRKTESLPQRTFGIAAGSAVFASMNDAQIEPHRHAHGGLRSRTPEISNPHTKKTPPRSPRASGEFSSGRSATGSLNSSQLRSRAPSPALITNSHMITSMPYVEFDQDPLLVNLFPAAPDLPYDPIPGLGRSDTFSSQASSLPYPEQDIMAGPWIEMPSEPELEWQPETGYIARSSEFVESDANRLSRVQTGPAATFPHTHSLAPNPPSLYRTTSAATVTPPMNRTTSYANDYGRAEGYHSTASSVSFVQQDDRNTVPPSRRAEPRQDAGEGASRLERLARDARLNPPHCPREYHEAGAPDWRTVRGAPTVHFCPQCIAQMVGTPFMDHLKAFKSPDRNARIKCAFELPWMVRAWSATHQKGLRDFSVLKTIADTDSCPATTHGDPLRIAMGLIAPPEYGRSFVPSFQLCPADFNKLAVLFPRLHSLFDAKSVNDKNHYCSLHTESSSFREFWTALEKVSNIIKVTGEADLAPVVLAIERKRRSQEEARMARGY